MEIPHGLTWHKQLRIQSNVTHLASLDVSNCCRLHAFLTDTYHCGETFSTDCYKWFKYPHPSSSRRNKGTIWSVTHLPELTCLWRQSGSFKSIFRLHSLFWIICSHPLWPLYVFFQPFSINKYPFFSPSSKFFYHLISNNLQHFIILLLF